LHGNIFLSVYHSGGRVLTSPRLISLSDARRLLASGPVIAVGGGAERLREAAEEIGQEIAVADREAWPDIVAVAKLGVAADPRTAPARPVYLKAPDVTLSGRSALPRAAQ